jgi:hypothetical protein
MALPLLAALAALIPFAVPGFAPPPGAEQLPSSTLVLTTTRALDTTVVHLHCEPTGGDHPHAAQACDDLLRSDGDVQAVEDTDGFCTLEYDPVHVTARGTWRGERVDFAHTYPNGCVMHTDTGVVFDF